ncbi:hypothetical protein EDE15_2103 [Edaphobacter aggregans]|uniref:Uncharacterized protein n=1 Tax=Edaphobacter aggregans TaxID=570835 RepID=A0A428MI77_9BACT|nr:hypothetical protein EDE15_2103 [Edaphobacter aggregans]
MVTEICPNAGIAIAEAKILPYNHFAFIVLVSIFIYCLWTLMPLHGKRLFAKRTLLRPKTVDK